MSLSIGSRFDLNCMKGKKHPTPLSPAADEPMEKSSKVKFSSSFQLLPWRLISFAGPNLIYRFSEDAACTQKALGDNGS